MSDQYFGWNGSRHSGVDHYWVRYDGDTVASLCNGIREHPRNVSVVFQNKLGRRCLHCEKKLGKGVDSL